MKYLSPIILCAAGLWISGCEDKETESATVDTGSTPQPSSISLDGSAPVAQTPAQAGPVPEVQVDFSSSAPPEKQMEAVVEGANAAYFQAQGAAEAPKNVAELLNRAIQVYGERRQETDEGDGPTWPVISDLNQLVRYKILRALPAAPSGKKYQMDPKTKVVTMVDK